MNSPLRSLAQDYAQPLRLVIVEDDLVHYRILKRIVSTQFPHLSIVGHCESVQELTAHIAGEKPDILLMDIQIRGGTAFEALKDFPECCFDTIVLSAQHDFHYAQEALRLGASDYIPKPYNAEDVIAALQKVIAKRMKMNATAQSNIQTSTLLQSSTSPINSKEKHWVIKTKDRALHILEWNQIVRLKADGKNTVVYLTDGKLLRIGKAIQVCLHELPQSLFYQTHRSHIINRSYFSYARDGFAFLTNGVYVDVSSRLWSQFLTTIKK